MTIRSERSFDHYTRGLELLRAIRHVWKVNEAIPHTHRGVHPSRNEQIEANILALLDEFDLTIPEWHYWAEKASNWPI